MGGLSTTGNLPSVVGTSNPLRTKEEKILSPLSCFLPLQDLPYRLSWFSGLQTGLELHLLLSLVSSLQMAGCGTPRPPQSVNQFLMINTFRYNLMAVPLWGTLIHSAIIFKHKHLAKYFYYIC